MPAAVFVEWQQWHGRHGFPVDRILWAVAVVGSYLGATWGGKANPSDLFPRLESRGSKNARIRAWLERAGKEVNGG